MGCTYFVNRIFTTKTVIIKNERIFYGKAKTSYLPEIQPKDSNVVEFVDLGIRSVFRVVDFRMHPDTFVVGVVDLFGSPLTLQHDTTINEDQRPGKLWKHLYLVSVSLYLVLWVWDHGRFPLSVHILIPVVRLLGIGIGNVLSLIPVLTTLYSES